MGSESDLRNQLAEMLIEQTKADMEQESKLKNQLVADEAQEEKEFLQFDPVTKKKEASLIQVDRKKQQKTEKKAVKKQDKKSKEKESVKEKESKPIDSTKLMTNSGAKSKDQDLMAAAI